MSKRSQLKQLCQATGATPEQLEAYSRYKQMRAVYGQVISHVAEAIWKERYEKHN